MAIPQDVRVTYTPEEYLALERAAEFKSEYIDGEIIAMSGGSSNHSLIKVALTRIVDTQLLGKPCTTFDSDMRTYVDARMYTYPDLSVACPVIRFDPEVGDNLMTPTVIVEVLSPSTEKLDRRTKFRRYRLMPSLKQYVLVSQDAPYVEVFTREGDMWTYSDFAGLDAAVHLASIDCTIQLSDLYSRVRFEPSPEESGGEGRDGMLLTP